MLFNCKLANLKYMIFGNILSCLRKKKAHVSVIRDGVSGRKTASQIDSTTGMYVGIHRID